MPSSSGHHDGWGRIVLLHLSWGSRDLISMIGRCTAWFGRHPVRLSCKGGEGNMNHPSHYSKLQDSEASRTSELPGRQAVLPESQSYPEPSSASFQSRSANSWPGGYEALRSLTGFSAFFFYLAADKVAPSSAHVSAGTHWSPSHVLNLSYQ